MFGLYESGIGQLTVGNIFMLFVGAGLIYLGIVKEMEPLLLVPIGFGIFAVNLPFAGIMVYAPDGFPALGGFKEIAEGKIGLLNLLYHFGLETEVIPLLIFLGVEHSWTSALRLPGLYRLSLELQPNWGSSSFFFLPT
jgi:Na+-transporting methylmalonyl-CoA/oxaloacetate decarboxylase beta subunit